MDIVQDPNFIHLLSMAGLWIRATDTYVPGRCVAEVDDAGSWDLGYSRTVKLGAGKVMTAYYINNADDEIQCNGGVRHIAATVFTP